MQHRTNKGLFGKAGGALAAALTAAAVLGAAAAAQAQSVAAVPGNAARPDPAIAVGLDVFTEKGEHMGELERVVQRNGRTYGVLAIREWEISPAQYVEFPYEALTVSNGVLTYDVDGDVSNPIRRDPNDNIDWESLDERTDLESQ